MKVSLRREMSIKGIKSEASNINYWLISGEINKLENLVLRGEAHLLDGKESSNIRSREFLRILPEYKRKISKLLEAVCIGDIESVQEHIRYKKCIQARHPFTMCSTLALAVIHNHPRVVLLLLSHPLVSINSKDVESRVPLHYAAAIYGMDGDSTMYDMLIDHMANESILDAEGYAPDNYKKVPELIDMKQIRGLNRYPITNGDEIDRLITDRNAPQLEEMVLNGEWHKIDNRIFPPGSRDLIRMLKELFMRGEAIHQSIIDNDIQTFKQLVDSYQMATFHNIEGQTPLHMAVILNREEFIQYLLMIYPKCISVENKDGRTAMHFVHICHEKPDIIESLESILLNSGAQPNDTADISPNSIKAERMMISQQLGRRSNSLGDEIIEDDKETINPEIEQRVLSINFNKRQYRVLENINHEGKSDQIWKIVKKHINNENLIKYIHNYRLVQNRLNNAIKAIEDNDIRKIRSMVDEELVQARDNRGLTLLHHAVLNEKHDIVEFIGNNFSKFINTVDQAGRSAVHYAAIQQNAIYDTLVDKGASIDVKDKDGFTAHYYRGKGDRIIRPLSPKKAPSLERKSTLNDVQHIIDNDAPSSLQIDEWLSRGNVTALEQVVLDGRGHLLVEKSSINTISQEFLQGLNPYMSKIAAIHKAVEEGDIRRVKSLIDRPQLATARDRFGMSVLHKALLHGQTNTVRYLLSKYPQIVNLTDYCGRTCLHYAAADPNGDHMIKVLQKFGGDAFIEDKFGHTPFYYRTHGKKLNVLSLKDNAVINQLITGQLNRPLLQDLEEDISDWIHTGNIGKLEELVLNGYAELLLGRTAQVNDADSMSFLEVLPQYQAKINSIHKAVEQGNLRAVKLLTDRKKLALCRDCNGLTPLHKAIVFNKIDIAKYLLRNYPQTVNAMDQNKRTPLHYSAAMRDGGYLYKLMRKVGADPNIFDCNGRPAKYYLRYPGEIDLERMRMDTKEALKQVLHNRVAPSYLESNIQQWIRESNIPKLEQLVLSGCGDLLFGKTSNNPETQIFLEELPNVLDTIEHIHKGIKEGDIEKIKTIMSTKKLALARDKNGCTPLHTAIVYEKTDIIRFIASSFTSVLNAPDYNKRTPMHYAAAAKDGGHYLKILTKAGADPMAVDNEGRTPDYYRRNTVFDLKMLKERDHENDVFDDDLIIADGPRVDEAPSPEYFSDGSSQPASPKLDDDDEIDRQRYEKFMQERLDMPTSDNGLYLARTVAPVLTKALAEVLLKRPADPINFISEWLIKYNDETDDMTSGSI
uniref:ANK_REP_REGION domain-containing protein n=1 Tax=Strongyloides venezuelensis TaxID=75913 RepID=A0A0K0F5M1_STRVS